MCLNIPGSHVCACNQGYSLTPNKITCEGRAMMMMMIITIVIIIIIIIIIIILILLLLLMIKIEIVIVNDSVSEGRSEPYQSKQLKRSPCGRVSCATRYYSLQEKQLEIQGGLAGDYFRDPLRPRYGISPLKMVRQPAQRTVSLPSENVLFLLTTRQPNRLKP